MIHRRKKGFANAIEKWFCAQMRSFNEDCLLGTDSSMNRYFDQNYVRRILQLDRKGREQFRRHSYLFVSLQLWHRTFMRPQPFAQH